MSCQRKTRAATHIQSIKMSFEIVTEALKIMDATLCAARERDFTKLPPARAVSSFPCQTMTPVLVFKIHFLRCLLTAAMGE